jgi:leucyl-tRNA synthetase
MFNVVNPDMICDSYGADTLRLYEMFLGPLEQSKPWDTKGIDGVNRFLKRVWRLFYDRDGFIVKDEKATPEELKVLHKLIGKVRSDIEEFSFNTAVSAFMIAVNELYDLKCNKREILEQLIILLSPFAPHITEEIWTNLNFEPKIYNASWPTYDESKLVKNEVEIAVQVCSKIVTRLVIPVDITEDDLKQLCLTDTKIANKLEGKTIVKFLYVKGKLVNIIAK